MKRIFQPWTGLLMALLIPGWFLAVPSAAGAQTRGGGHGSGGGGGSRAAGGGGGSRAAGGGGGSREAGGGGGSRAAGGGGSTQGAVGTAVPRGDRGGSGAGNAGKGATADNAAPRGDSAAGSPQSAAPPRTTARDGNPPVGRAVPRSVIPPVRGGGGIFVPGGYGGYGAYYPWGFGGLGVGGYYRGYYDPYGGYYDPYGGFYDPYGSYSGYPQSGYTSGYEGKLHLKVKPREASVYVDGYYVGLVDDFDGVFQRLHLDAGPHHVEISAPGYEPLTFDVRIEPDRTLTYHGELKKLP